MTGCRQVELQNVFGTKTALQPTSGLHDQSVGGYWLSDSNVSDITYKVEQMKNHQAEHEVIEQRWDEIRSSIRERWPQLTEDDVRQINGDARKLVALVHQKTGDNIETIENAIDEIAAGSEGLLSRVTRQAQQVAQSATDQVTHVTMQAYEAVEHQVEASPARSLVTVFGAGFAIGICVTALFHASSSRQTNRWTPHW